MTWMEEVSYQYRENEYFFVDLPAIFQFCLPALLIEFLRLCVLQIATNVIYQLITSDSIFRFPDPIKNILGSVLGSLLLAYFYPVTSVAFLLTAIVLCYLLVAKRKLLFVLLCSALALGWFTGLYAIELRLLQGPLMIVTMKVIAVVMSDAEAGSLNLLLFMHYCLSCSSVVFGPILPFDEFQRKIFKPKFSIRLRPLLNALTGTFLTFITANCVCQSVEWAHTGEEIAPYHIRFLSAYKQALEFRMSHYFICYLSTFQMHLGTPQMATAVTDFWAIEAPRSMKSVVRSWNVPMHKFLKRFIFQRIRPTLGPAVAIFCTFLISAGLHLFEVRVTVVLLALSLVSVIESRLESHLPSSVAEIWMRVTTFIHLVFFGCIMMGHDAEQDGSYFHFVMERWLELGFISFKILIVECVLCVVFEVGRLLAGRTSSGKEEKPHTH